MRSGSSLSTSSAPKQPWPTIALHWLTVLALLTGLSALWWREAVDDKALRDTLLTLHRHMGLLVWLALVARLLARGLLPRVDAAGPMPWHLRAAAALSHLTLYGLLFSLPLVGWMLTNAHGHPVRVLGLFNLPNLVAADPDEADVYAERHEVLAWVLAAMVALHIAAALWHHFFRRDDVLRSIMPGRR
jgi:cytochrome b561